MTDTQSSQQGSSRSESSPSESSRSQSSSSGASKVETRADGLGFACPRCAQAVTERLYGPCRSCRTELVATYGGARRDVEVARFEPRMHVTPNAVATKD